MISVSIFGFLCLRTQTVDWETVDMGSLYPTQIPKMGALRSSHVWLTRSGFYFLPSEGRFPMFPGCPASCRLSSWLLLDLVLWTVLSVPRVAWEARAGGFAPTFTSLAMGWIPQWRCLPLRWWWSHLDVNQHRLKNQNSNVQLLAERRFKIWQITEQTLTSQWFSSIEWGMVLIVIHDSFCGMIDKYWDNNDMVYVLVYLWVPCKL